MNEHFEKVVDRPTQEEIETAIARAKVVEKRQEELLMEIDSEKE